MLHRCHSRSPARCFHVVWNGPRGGRFRLLGRGETSPRRCGGTPLPPGEGEDYWYAVAEWGAVATAYHDSHTLRQGCPSPGGRGVPPAGGGVRSFPKLTTSADALC